MLHLDQSGKGKWIKVGEQWLQLKRITKVRVVQGELVIDYKNKKGVVGQVIYRGEFVNHVKGKLDKELPA